MYSVDQYRHVQTHLEWNQLHCNTFTLKVELGLMVRCTFLPLVVATRACHVGSAICGLPRNGCWSRVSLTLGWDLESRLLRRWTSGCSKVPQRADLKKTVSRLVTGWTLALTLMVSGFKRYCKFYKVFCKSVFHSHSSWSSQDVL